MSPDVLCCFGNPRTLSWSEANPKQRLFLIGATENPFPHDSRVKVFPLDSPLQLEPVAKQVAWATAFRTCAWIGETDDPSFPAFRQIWELTRRAAELLVSDSADFGVLALQNGQRNLARPFHSALSLSFPNVPAVIVGAGPSLARAGPLLASLKEKALILTGGNGLRRIPFPSHFAALIDPKEAVHVPPDVPLCITPRALAPERDGMWLAPDPHFAFLNWIAGMGEPFDGGWTVGNFLTALAVRWGCNPIVWVGMDCCYDGLRKYAGNEEAGSAGSEGLIRTVNVRGDTVWTQEDWLMGIQWAERLAEQERERTFIQVTDTGMGFKEPVQMHPLTERFDWPKRVVTVPQAPLHAAPRWAAWHASLERCAGGASEDEPVYEYLLQPLWRVWKPLIERELEGDPHPEKLRINERLFYNRVLQEHLHVR